MEPGSSIRRIVLDSRVSAIPGIGSIRIMTTRIAVAFALAAVVWAGPAPGAPPTVADAAWLAGRWVGEGLGGELEETWSPPAGGQMVGHFRLVREGKPEFYEFLMIDVAPTGLRLRVRHFNPDFTAWEDRESFHTFEPAGIEPGSIKFRGLSISRKGDEITILVTLKREDGSSKEHLIRLRRAPL